LSERPVAFVRLLPFSFHRRSPFPKCAEGHRGRLLSGLHGNAGERLELLRLISTRLEMPLRETHVSRSSHECEEQIHLVMFGDRQLIHRHLLRLNAPLSSIRRRSFIRRTCRAPIPEHVNLTSPPAPRPRGEPRPRNEKGRLGFPRRPSGVRVNDSGIRLGRGRLRGEAAQHGDRAIQGFPFEAFEGRASAKTEASTLTALDGAPLPHRFTRDARIRGR